MAKVYYCKNERRRQQVSGVAGWNGIDFLEIATEDQKTIHLHFLKPVPGQSGAVPATTADNILTVDNFVIEGGVRIVDVQIEEPSPGVKELPVVGAGSPQTLVLIVDQAGDFSTYTLRLVKSPYDLDTPDGFDPYLAEIDFSFKIDCPSDFDCQSSENCVTVAPDRPRINYLAKDYNSFRQLMLDRMSLLIPDWKERNPADLQVALVELMAYMGDRLSYYQDAVATEAYLGRARRRSSLRRHARLLDYSMHEGCNARVWARVRVTPGGASDGLTVSAGTPLLTRLDNTSVAIASNDYDKALLEKPVVFETMHDIKLDSKRNEIAFHTWSDNACCLPEGSTSATLARPAGLSLNVGDVLIFEEVLSPTTSEAADADPQKRHAVRLTKVEESEDPIEAIDVYEIEWSDGDALPFALCLSVEGDSSGVSVAWGNVVLADHGQSIDDETLEPESVPEEGNYRPRLQQTEISFGVEYEHKSALKESASVATTQDPHEALPLIELQSANWTWSPQIDLLSSGLSAREFVAEVEDDGIARLRFGDGVLGRKPVVGSEYAANYRIGNGSEGNIGSEAIAHFVWGYDGIEVVTNPLPATTGTDPEDIEEARRDAPQAFRVQQRAVTEADYADVAERNDSVQKAVAKFRWTGSWYTVFVSIDRKGGFEVDETFKEEMLDFFERYRMAGYDLEITSPQIVPLEIEMSVCVKAEYRRFDVKSRLLEAFGSSVMTNGEYGFFHPDNFTFAQAVYLSEIYATAMAVEGIASVTVDTFQRFGKEADGELTDGYLKPGELEIIRLENDPSYPENGKISFELEGGI